MGSTNVGRLRDNKNLINQKIQEVFKKEGKNQPLMG